MEARAFAKMQRITPRKAKLVLDLIRGEKLDEAIVILKNTDTKAAKMIYKLLISASANAINNNNTPEDVLYVKACYANEGPTLKRIRPRAQGRASAINKRTSHITIVLDDINEKGIKPVKEEKKVVSKTTKATPKKEAAKKPATKKPATKKTTTKKTTSTKKTTTAKKTTTKKATTAKKSTTAKKTTKKDKEA